MPELPEVETIRRDLAPLLQGRHIVEVAVLDAKAIREPGVAEFIEGLRGRTVVDLRRRGKYLLFALSSGQTMVVHLKMTGALLWRSLDHPPDPHTRAIWHLEGGAQLRFADPRRLGNLWLVDSEDEVVGKLGPEPLEPAFAPEVLAARLAHRHAPIKALLCDQEVVAGLGNIYADEALWTAAIHPRRPGGELTSNEIDQLHQAIGQVLTQALDNRGTSFSDYRDAQGRPGGNQAHLMVYRRVGQPCLRCGAAIQRMVLRGRSAYFCSNCPQRGA